MFSVTWRLRSAVFPCLCTQRPLDSPGSGLGMQWNSWQWQYWSHTIFWVTSDNQEGWRRLFLLKLSNCYSVMSVASACMSMCNVTGTVFTQLKCHIRILWLSPVTLYKTSSAVWVTLAWIQSNPESSHVHSSMVGLSAGMHSSEMIALSTPEPVLIPGRAKPPNGWAWFPHPVQPNLVAGLPVLFLGLLFIILYRPGLVTLFISLPSFSFRCSPSCHLPWSHFLAWLFQTLWAVSRTDFRSAIFQINFLCSSLLPFFITASTMIVFSIVIGNSQLSPCSLQFSSKSACGKSAGHLMLKSLYYSKVMFQCALTWLFNFWACDLQFIGSSGTVSIIFWRSSPPTNSNWLLMEICTPQFLWKYSTGLKLIKLIRRTHWHPSSCSLKLISP